MRLVLSFTLLVFFSLFARAQPCGFFVQDSVTHVSCNSLCDGTASITVTGGTAPYTFLWQNNSTASSVSGLCIGQYGVNIIDANGCDYLHDMPVITEPNTLIINASKTDIICAITGQIKAAPSGGTSPYNYSLNNEDPVTSSVFENLEEGIYDYRTIDDKGCTADTTLEITEITCIDPVASKAFTPNGDGYTESWSITNIDLFPNCLVTVYDRWGQKIWQSEGYSQAWNGDGVFGKVPTSTYYYIIELDRDDKNSNFVKGSVSVVR